MVNNMNTLFQANKAIIYFIIMALVLIFVGLNQSWALALGIINMSLISAIMALGVNIQWGYAGLMNVGIMGFAALRRCQCSLDCPAASHRSSRCWRT